MSFIPADELARRVREGAADGLNIFALHVLGQTVPLTPNEFGDLRSSLVPSMATPEDLAASVSSDSPYAVPQHEHLEYRHDDGQAKFLEIATNGAANQMGPISKTAVERRLRG